LLPLLAAAIRRRRLGGWLDWGSISELMEVVALAEAGKINMLVEHFPLERAGDAYPFLGEGKIQGAR
jgi:D-arabinose 1-dehydrogenase-like Zn-dependent alcohol dehydrogenase